MFSILSPRKHIPDHCGPYKGIVRYHLALKVPEPREQCRIRVGDEIVTWEEGRSLIFDDTYEHEVWNDTDGERVVLFVDVVRPLRFPMNVVNAIAISAIARSTFIADAKRRHKGNVILTASSFQPLADQIACEQIAGRGVPVFNRPRVKPALSPTKADKIPQWL